jgi:hypothetical protein
VFGLRAGWYIVSLSETDVIKKYAALYVNGANGRRSEDCSAIPGGDSGAWIIVTCGRQSCGADLLAPVSEYYVNRWGSFMHGGDSRCRHNRAPET